MKILKSRLKFSTVWTSCCRLRKVIHIRCCLIKSGSTLEHAFTIEHTFPLSWLDTASIQLFLKTLQPIYNLNCINLYRIRYRKFCVNKMIRLTNASSPSNHSILKNIFTMWKSKIKWAQQLKSILINLYYLSLTVLEVPWEYLMRKLWHALTLTEKIAFSLGNLLGIPFVLQLTLNKVTIYKSIHRSCGELSQLVQRTTRTFGLTQSC